MKYGFIGCGNMGGAIAKALSRATKEIMVSDRSGKAKAFAEELGIVYSDAETIAARCDRIFIAVKPHMVQEVLSLLQKVLGKRKPLLITMAAGMEIAKLEQLAGTELPVIRIMPNTPTAIGKGATNAPFQENPLTVPSSIVFTGTPGQVLAASTEEVNLTMNGEAIWMNVTRDLGGGLTETFSAFDAIDSAITDLESGVNVSGAVTTGMARLDRVLGQFQTARSQAGEMLNRLDGIESRLADGKLAARNEKSNAEDLDMVEAISQFQNKQMGYEAALQSYASIQKMSLFQYIS